MSDLDQLADLFESRGFPVKRFEYTVVIGTFPNEILFSFNTTKSVQAVWSREDAEGPATPVSGIETTQGAVTFTFGLEGKQLISIEGQGR